MRPTCVASTLALALIPALTACQVSSGGTKSEGSDYPSDQIEVIVGSAAGGPTDIGARALAKCMEKDLDQTIVVKNVDGASGAVGMRELIAAKPDGYTLNMTAGTTLTLSPYIDDLGFTYKDVQPIGRLFGTSMIFVAPAGSYATAKELFADAKKNPGKITVGTPGPTSPKHIVLDGLRDAGVADLKSVPLGDQAGQVAALLGKNVDVAAVEATDDVKQHIDSGKVVPLFAISPLSVSWLKDLPTLEDLGHPDLMLPKNEFPLYGPAGMPKVVVSTLEDAMEGCVEDEQVIKTVGEEEIISPFSGADETAKWLAESAKTYQGLVG